MYNMIGPPAWLNSTPVITCYHPFILLVSFCVLSVCVSIENIILLFILMTDSDVQDYSLNHFAMWYLFLFYATCLFDILTMTCHRRRLRGAAGARASPIIELGGQMYPFAPPKSR